MRHCALLLALIPPVVNAQVNEFDLHQNGKSVGHGSFAFETKGNEVKLVSNFIVNIKNFADGTRDEFTYTDGYAFLEGIQTSKTMNLQESFVPNKQRKELTIAFVFDGSGSSRIIDMKPNLVVLPSFDVGAAQALLTLATSHPTPDNHYTIYIPDNGAAGKARSDGPSFMSPAPVKPEDSLPPGPHSYDSIWVKGGAVTGTLDGKPLKVNTYALAFGKFRWIFFADEQNNLMQVNVSLIHGSYIRDKFKLDAIP
jgi:hypothetical protein